MVLGPKMNAGATEVKIHVLEQSLEDLKHAYELFFSGQARVEPRNLHDEFRKKLLTMNPAELTSTSHKFRFVNLKSRYNQLHVHWEKICQQIEDGTYRRDKFLAKVHEMEREEKVKSKSNEPSRPAPSPVDISEKETRAIQTLYKKLKESSGEAAKLPALDKFTSQMSKQIIHFKDKNPGKNFEFRLAKDAKGKVQIKIAA